MKQASAATVSTSTVSGSFDLTFSNYAGVSQYTVQYRYPSVVSVGQNLSVTVTVFVDQLTELKLYLYDWGMIGTIYAPSGEPTKAQILSQNAGTFLYQGSHWGPITIEIPVSASSFNVAAGQTFATPLVLQWIADVQYDKPYNYHFDESDQRVAGNVTIVNSVQSNGSGNLYYYLGAGAAALIVIGVVVAWMLNRRRPPKEQPTVKDSASQMDK